MKRLPPTEGGLVIWDDERYVPVSRAYERRFTRLATEHAFDNLRAIDLSLREFFELLDDLGRRPEVIAEAQGASGESKELVLLVAWHVPPHVVSVVSERHAQEKVVTVYEPDPDVWSPDRRRRR